MRGIRVWARLLGLRRAVVEDVTTGIEGEVFVSVRPGWRERDRCGVCRRRCPGYDLLDGLRRIGSMRSVSPRSRQQRFAIHRGCSRAAPWARPIGELVLSRLLKRIGVDGNDARRAALLQLAGQLPAAISADLLGVHVSTATQWAQIAGRPWGDYLAMRRR